MDKDGYVASSIVWWCRDPDGLSHRFREGEFLRAIFSTWVVVVGSLSPHLTISITTWPPPSRWVHSLYSNIS